MKNSRYICHVEDQPMVSSQRADTLEEAIALVKKSVQSCLDSNGCGDGLVIDTKNNEIVAVIGCIGSECETGSPVADVIAKYRFASEDAARHAIAAALAWDAAFANNGPFAPDLPLAWYTMSGTYSSVQGMNTPSAHAVH